ncbi:hypothetical protein SprV_0200931700 [Sparganum proliferum]
MAMASTVQPAEQGNEHNFRHYPKWRAKKKAKSRRKLHPTLVLIHRLLEQEKVLKDRSRPLRTYDEIHEAIERRIQTRDLSDAVTMSRKQLQRTDSQEDDGQARSQVSEDESSEEEDEEVKRMDFTESILLNAKDSTKSASYWQALKVFRYFLATNRQGTLISLIALRALNFRTAGVVQAFEKAEGTTLLLNLLSVEDPPVQIGAMRVLLKLSTIAYFARLIVHLGGIEALLENLHQPNEQIKRAAARILTKLCILKKARKKLCAQDGVPLFVCMLDEYTQKLQEIHSAGSRELRYLTATNRRNSVSLATSLKTLERRIEQKRRPIDSLLVTICSALGACSKSPDGRRAMRETGMVSVLGRLILLAHPEVLECIMGILELCCQEKYFRVSVWTEGMVPKLVDCLKASTLNVKIRCSLTLARCCSEPCVRDGLRKLKSLEMMNRFLTWELTNSDGAMESLRRVANVRGGVQEDENFVNALLLRYSVRQAARPVRREEQPQQPHGVKLNLLASQAASGKEERKKRAKDAMASTEHETFLSGLTRLLYKVCLSPENAIQLYRLGSVQHMIRLITELPRLFGPFRRPVCSASEKLNGFDRAEKIVKHALWALALMADIPEIRNAIATMSDGIRPWLVLLRLAIDDLMPATCASIRVLLMNASIRNAFIEHGGVRMLFAYVTNGQRDAKLEALRTIHTCLENIQNTGRVLKPLTSSMDTIVSFIRSLKTDEEIQRAALETIAQMARDRNTLAIMTDLGVTQEISRLLSVATDDEMCISICHALAACSYYGKNAFYFGDTNCIPVLAALMKSRNEALRSAAVKAIHGLSFDPENAAQIWGANICKLLTSLAAGNEESTQKAATGTLTNIRHLEFIATYQFN